MSSVHIVHNRFTSEAALTHRSSNDSIVPDTAAALPLAHKMSTNIVLLGETNVGKTAIIDLLANVLTGVKLEDFKPVHAEDNEQDGSSTGSRTKKPILYSIKRADGHTVNVLDTPGLADSRGVDVDNQHMEDIVNVINVYLEAIDAVIIVANGTLPRLSVTTEYALALISSMFPRSLVGNVAFLFTMVASPLSFNFEREQLPQELQKAPQWLIDNPFVQWIKYQEKLHAEPPLDEDILEDMLHHVESSYKKTLRLLGEKILKWLDLTNPQSTSSVHQLDLLSKEIETAISNVIARLEQVGHKHSQLISLEADEATVEQAQKEFDSLERELNELEKELSALCDTYDNLTLSGTFVGHVSSAIRLLRLREEMMKRDGAPREALERIGECIKRTENKRKVVEDADRQAGKGEY